MGRDNILSVMRGEISRTGTSAMGASGVNDRVGAYSMHETVEQSASADPGTPVAKSKGGRKPIYTSLEQKKQRNRDSQAAFRERRREYISELEKIVQEQKEKLQTSETAQISSKDECLMLKYKNSLLERILLEKGIDVNAELNRTLEFPPRLPAKMKRKHRDHSHDTPSHHKQARISSRSSHTHSCCHGGGSHSGSGMDYHPVQAPSNRQSRHYSPNTGRVHKHARMTPQIFTHPKHSLGKYSPLPPIQHIKELSDPRLIRTYSTRYACHCIGRRLSHHKRIHRPLHPHLSTRQATPSPFQIAYAECPNPLPLSTSNLPSDHTSPTTTTTHSASSPPEILDQNQAAQALAQIQSQSLKTFDFDFQFDPSASYAEILGAEKASGFDMDLEFLSSLQA
ncbi:uncharacterized protein PAC_12072 [Phialocephala subalpina]|uniref:BZIP domain-containing protein n=1 Tax=Phialocephala subalpina TaxID=576137 RepID=A0A1L7XAY2_9HELO|nr:uncharacterized protein PAC_12072 [Phialocephala subalpina]